MIKIRNIFYVKVLSYDLSIIPGKNKVLFKFYAKNFVR